MNDLDYLNQISQGVNKPTKPTSLFDKKMKIVLGILGGAIVFFIIIASALGSSSTPEPTEITELGRLYTTAKEITNTINEYNGSVNSPSLRSTGSSFSTLLSEISAKSSTYLTDVFGITIDSVLITASDQENINVLNSNLNKAKLNGLLDRTYASEMRYQIRLLVVLENSIYKKTSNSSIKEFLESSTTSLNHLEETFGNFSQAD